MVKAAIDAEELVIFAKSTCPHCIKVITVIDKYFAENGIDVVPYVIHMDLDINDGQAIRENIKEISNMGTVPVVYLYGKIMGGCESTLDAINNGTLIQSIKKRKDSV